MYQRDILGNNHDGIERVVYHEPQVLAGKSTKVTMFSLAVRSVRLVRNMCSLHPPCTTGLWSPIAVAIPVDPSFLNQKQYKSGVLFGPHSIEPLLHPIRRYSRTDRFNGLVDVIWRREI